MMHVDIAQQQQALSRLEWKVVALAIREAGEVRVRGSSPLARAARWLWATLSGAPAQRPLGDPRLDALRRFVDASRRGSDPAPALTCQLHHFGYSNAQLAAVAQLAH